MKKEIQGNKSTKRDHLVGRVGTSVIFSGNLLFQVSENCQNFDQFIVTLNRLLDYLLI